jgi:Bacterial surface proteins containing Ig-like domains
MKKKNLFAVLCFVLMGTYAFGQEPGDTTHVTPFSLQENQITLSVGESCQLHITPADAQVRWMYFSGVDINYIAVVDDNGLVTALKAGNRAIGVESPDGSIRQYCQVTVVNEGGLRSDRIKFDPTDECEWEDVEFSLTNDGKFTAQGVYMGNGAQPDYLNYIVTDGCVFLWFDINYEDSTMMFHYQPFNLEIENCNAQTYNVYFRNKSLVMGPQETFVRYAVRRGGTTEIERIVINREEGVIYDLKGLPVMDIPKNGFYIKDGKIIYIE